MRLSELQYKEIVNLEGKKIGNIVDVKVDRDGRILSLVLENDKRFLKFKNNDNEVEVSWDKIEKIGEDVILVNF